MENKLYKFEFTNGKIQIRNFNIISESNKCYKVRSIPERRIHKSSLDTVSCSAPEYPMWSMENSNAKIKEYRKKLSNAIEHTKMLYEAKLSGINAAFNRVKTATVCEDNEKIIMFSYYPNKEFDKTFYIVTRRTPDTIDFCAEFDDILGNTDGQTSFQISKIGTIMEDEKSTIKEYVWSASEEENKKNWMEFKSQASIMYNKMHKLQTKRPME